MRILRAAEFDLSERYDRGSPPSRFSNRWKLRTRKFPIIGTFSQKHFFVSAGAPPAQRRGIAARAVEKTAGFALDNRAAIRTLRAVFFRAR